MGVLDDAIREHLELKRKHGATEEELREQEAEALGPARRDVPAAADEEAVAPEPVAAPDEPPAIAEEVPALAEESPALAAEAPVGIEDVAADLEESAPRLEEPPTRVEESPAPVGEEPPGFEAPTDVEPALPDDHPSAPQAPAEPAPAGLDELDEPDEVPREESLEPPRPESDAEEDVLEETPDFLQETPEHDRLWFEQKPPRDFDFDE